MQYIFSFVHGNYHILFSDLASQSSIMMYENVFVIYFWGAVPAEIKEFKVYS